MFATTAALVLAAAASEWTVLLVGLLMTALVAGRLWMGSPTSSLLESRSK
jgi:hypothetical protein